MKNTTLIKLQTVHPCKISNIRYLPRKNFLITKYFYQDEKVHIDKYSFGPIWPFARSPSSQKQSDLKCKCTRCKPPWLAYFSTMTQMSECRLFSTHNEIILSQAEIWNILGGQLLLKCGKEQEAWQPICFGYDRSVLSKSFWTRHDLKKLGAGWAQRSKLLNLIVEFWL